MYNIYIYTYTKPQIDRTVISHATSVVFEGSVVYPKFNMFIFCSTEAGFVGRRAAGRKLGFYLQI